MRKNMTIFGLIMFIIGTIIIIKDVAVPVGIAFYYGIVRHADIIWTDTFANNLLFSNILGALMTIFGYITLIMESDREFDK